jgi:hypothetical protein
MATKIYVLLECDKFETGDSIRYIDASLNPDKIADRVISLLRQGIMEYKNSGGKKAVEKFETDKNSGTSIEDLFNDIKYGCLDVIEEQQ